LHLNDFPESVLMIGGGVIALEMGQMFARFGTQVIILERGDRLLSEFDLRLTTKFADILRSEGIQIMTEVESERVEGRPEGICLYATVKGAPVGLCAERLMLAVGTAPATDGIGLEKAGVEVDANGFIQVDAGLQTTAENIWAAGDCTGPPLIAPAGAREALVAVENMMDAKAERTIDHTFSPMAVFVDPEFATVGLTTDQARAKGLEVEEAYIDLAQVPKAHVMGRLEGGVLLCCEKPSGKVLGCQILAPRAADIIHEVTLAVRFGLTVSDLTTTVHVYPSISDGVRMAARELCHRLNLPIV
ncbi:MAG: NAD(P)/FAD-dependent oxidoreductase, partial [Desulfuromonadales bacterium]|nr:NAD(P)/FAD-dependent oxidoreductase [Desulfuromonadales bacterium]NIS42335.1 NAD(P)/FAD-dependent oxidoreductase [Desulfuromonadales bacterium]